MSRKFGGRFARSKNIGRTGEAAHLAAILGLLFRVIRFLAWLIFATWLGRKLLGWLVGSADVRSRGDAREQAANATAPAKQLFRDPVCGTHVLAGIAVTFDHAGETLHFCSPECREKFRAGLQK